MKAKFGDLRNGDFFTCEGLNQEQICQYLVKQEVSLSDQKIVTVRAIIAFSTAQPGSSIGFIDLPEKYKNNPHIPIVIYSFVRDVVEHLSFR